MTKKLKTKTAVILVLFLIGIAASTISTTFSADVTEEPKKTDSLSTSYSNGATYCWTWISGDKTINEYGVYGTKGVPDRANYPGARLYSVSWMDTDGNFWLFGGNGYAEPISYGNLNDLWRFNITSKEWAWMSGNKTTDEYGVYGTKGVPDKANYPGVRHSSVSWTDTDGNLWLFGGEGYAESGDWGQLNDLWRFTISSKEWAWMSGNKTTDEYGVYGTKGVPDEANYPGSREEFVSWTDKDGNLWLFGGDGYAESDTGRLNDLWRFTISSKEWAWMSGNKTAWEFGVYGTKGVPDKANYPGTRRRSVSWTDTDGNLWLFGGDGYNESGGNGNLNDLWRFTISSKEWAWMSGNKTIGEYGVYGTMGVPDKANYPGARQLSVTWTNGSENLWLFGGSTYNDLWRFNITSKEWAWMSGKKTKGIFSVYGTKGVPDMASHPGSRSSSVSWTDTNGSLWLFGGLGYAEYDIGYMNDLWRFKLGCAGQIPSTGVDDDDDDDDDGKPEDNLLLIVGIALVLSAIAAVSMISVILIKKHKDSSAKIN